jgi:hypothetical protein
MVVEQPLELLDELRAQECRHRFTLFRWRTVTPFRFRHSQHAFPASRAELAAHGPNRRQFASPSSTLSSFTVFSPRRKMAIPSKTFPG